jgi:hypothetical protein
LAALSQIASFKYNRRVKRQTVPALWAETVQKVQFAQKLRTYPDSSEPFTVYAPEIAIAINNADPSGRLARLLILPVVG